jgi:hypothetical protein
MEMMRGINLAHRKSLHLVDRDPYAIDQEGAA